MNKDLVDKEFSSWPGKEMREIFASEVTIHNSDMLIFLDETSCDRRDILRCYAYS